MPVFPEPKVPAGVHGPDFALTQRNHPTRRPGGTRRRKRLRVEHARLTDALAGRAPHLSLNERALEATRLQSEQAQYPPALQRCVDRLAPTSTSPPRGLVVPEVELAASRRLPVMRWLREQLVSAPRGRPADRSFALAVLEHMATLSLRPEVRSATSAIWTSPLAMWAFDYPVAPARASLYEQIHGICQRNPSSLALQVNVELVRQLSELSSGGAPAHPDVGRVGVVDATMLEAHVPQQKPNGPAERAAVLEGWDRVGFQVYTDSSGQVTARCHGYKWVAICDLASTLPLVWVLCPATVPERDACRELIKTLFALWPTCPMTYLIGDALYDQEEAFAAELEFAWGIHPCFPRSGTVSRALAHSDTGGVPRCEHGLMHREKAEGFPDADWRARSGTPRGTIARTDEARIRWRCAIGDPACHPQTTRPRDNARLYTFLPHAGESPKSYLRHALLVRRNAVEALFAILRNRGLGGTGQQRLKLVGDSPAEWITSLTALHLTAARVAHATGGYDDSFAQASALDHLTEPTADEPFPAPTAAEGRRVAAIDPGELAVAPRSAQPAL